MAPFHAASVELCGFLFDRGKTGGGYRWIVASDRHKLLFSSRPV